MTYFYKVDSDNLRDEPLQILGETMGITLQENALFSLWSSHKSSFVSDGVVDESAYLESERKLLFILKEVNDPGPDGGGWDLRKFLRTKNDRTHTWTNLSRWVLGIQQLEMDYNWSDIEIISDGQRQSLLQSIAVINLKKTPGTHTADAVSVGLAAQEDKHNINKQFNIYNADLVICCGTSIAFHETIFFPNDPVWRTTKRGVGYHEYTDNRFVINFSHPMARVAPNFLYYGLIDALREILIS